MATERSMAKKWAAILAFKTASQFSCPSLYICFLKDAIDAVRSDEE